MFTLKYARKAQYKKCQRMLKLEYLLSRMEVFVFDNDNHCDHESDQLKRRGANKKYLWTEEHEQIFPPLMLASWPDQLLKSFSGSCGHMG